MSSRDLPVSPDRLPARRDGPEVSAGGERSTFREVEVAPDPARSSLPPALACTSKSTVDLAAHRALPILLGMHIDDEDKAGMVRHYAESMREAWRGPVDDRPPPHAIHPPAPRSSAASARSAVPSSAPNGSLVERTPKDGEKFQRQAVRFHLRNARSWGNDRAGADLAQQVDPDFEHSPRALERSGAAPVQAR